MNFVFRYRKKAKSLIFVGVIFCNLTSLRYNFTLDEMTACSPIYVYNSLFLISLIFCMPHIWRKDNAIIRVFRIKETRLLKNIFLVDNANWQHPTFIRFYVQHISLLYKYVGEYFVCIML